MVADVADAADRAALVDRVLDEHGRLDAVVLNAGLGWAGLLEDMPGEAVEGIVALNLTGAIELTRLSLPHLLAAAGEHGRADVVAVSSVAAWSQVPPLTVYSATKAGLHGFVKGLRREVTARGVRVHTVNPFFVQTEWLARGHGHPPESDADARDRLSRGMLAGPRRRPDRVLPDGRAGAHRRRPAVGRAGAARRAAADRPDAGPGPLGPGRRDPPPGRPVGGAAHPVSAPVSPRPAAHPPAPGRCTAPCPGSRC